jgi:hypothetical protein
MREEFERRRSLLLTHLSLSHYFVENSVPVAMVTVLSANAQWSITVKIGLRIYPEMQITYPYVLFFDVLATK